MLHLIMRYLTTSTMAHLVKFGTTWGSVPWKYRWCSHWPRNDRGQYKVYNMTLQGGHPLTQARAEKPTQPSHLVVFCRDDVENPPMCGTFFPWKEPIKRGISNGGLVESILKWYLYDHVFLGCGVWTMTFSSCNWLPSNGAGPLRTGPRQSPSFASDSHYHFQQISSTVQSSTNNLRNYQKLISRNINKW
jgi:hypothetical protein